MMKFVCSLFFGLLFVHFFYSDLALAGRGKQSVPESRRLRRQPLRADYQDQALFERDWSAWRAERDRANIRARRHIAKKKLAEGQKDQKEPLAEAAVAEPVCSRPVYREFRSKRLLEMQQQRAQVEAEYELAIRLSREVQAAARATGHSVTDEEQAEAADPFFSSLFPEDAEFLEVMRTSASHHPMETAGPALDTAADLSGLEMDDVFASMFEDPELTELLHDCSEGLLSAVNPSSVIKEDFNLSGRDLSTAASGRAPLAEGMTQGASQVMRPDSGFTSGHVTPGFINVTPGHSEQVRAGEGLFRAPPQPSTVHSERVVVAAAEDDEEYYNAFNFW